MAAGTKMVPAAQGKVMVPIRTKTEPRCKICMHPQRIAIETLMMKRTQRQLDTDGNRVTREYIKDFALREWGLTLSDENIEVHSRKHLRYKESLERAGRELGRQSDKLLQMTVLTEIMKDLDADFVLDEIIGRGIKNIREEDGASITVDHVLSAIKTKKSSSSSTAMDGLVDAAARAVNVVLDKVEGEKPPVIEAEPVEDAEFEEVEEDLDIDEEDDGWD